jgi:hypothetical protein
MTAFQVTMCLNNDVQVNNVYKNCQVCLTGWLADWLAISISVGPDFQLMNHHTDFDKI